MKIALYSDLHLECGIWYPPIGAEAADVIVLAGDIASSVHGIRWAAESFPGKPVIYVAGNHEYYGAHLGLLAEMRRQAKQLGVHFLERNAIEIDGVRFMGCTLWSGFSLFGGGQHMADAMTIAERTINDYGVIFAHGGKLLEARDTLALHRTAVKWLDRVLANPFPGKTVVVTHFAPHRGCVAPVHRNSSVSPYFVTDLAWLMAKHSIALWCHGHTHTNNDFEAEGGCRVVANQFGYPGERSRNGEMGFRDDLVLEV